LVEWREGPSVRIIDRYVWRELLVPFLLGLFVFTFLLLIDKIFDLTDLIINKGVPVDLVGRLLLYILPAFLVLTIPMAFLLAILVAFGRLSADLEVVALKASGVSPLRLLRPVLVFGVGVTAATALLMLEGMPRGNYAFKSLVFDIIRVQASVGIKERVFNDSFGRYVLYVEEIAADHVGLRNVFVADERDPDRVRLVTAREGRLLSDEASRRVMLQLMRGAVHETERGSLQKYREITFRQYDLSLSLENPLVRQGEAPKGDREMRLSELREHAAVAARARGNPNPYLVEIHKKYAIPVACVVFALVGVPLGIRAHRGGRWAAFVLMLPIVLFYYVFLTLGESLGDAGRMPPWLAMWGPNLIVAAVGLGLLRAVVQERRIPPWLGMPFVVMATLGLRFLVRMARHLRLFQRTARVLRDGMDDLLGRPRVIRRGRVATARRRGRHPRVRRATALFNIVDRYLCREFLVLFGYGLALATIVVVIGDLMTTLDRYLKTRPPFQYIVEHFLYRTPPYVYQGLHIVMLMSTILLVLGLSRNNELTALKASGVSLYRVSLPIFVLAGAITVGALGFQEVALPVLNQRATEVDEAKIKRRTLPQLQKRTEIWYRGREGEGRVSRIYHIDLLDPANREMSGIAILELGPDFVLRRRWDARLMRWSEIGQGWEIQDGVVRQLEPGRPDRVETFKTRPLALPEQFADFARVPKAPDVMNYVELRDYIRRLREGGHRVGKYLVDLYAKLSFPFAHLIMALVGIPFALQSPRAGRLIGIALCLALGLGYFLTHSAALALARTEILPPVVAAWSANVLFASLGLFLFLRART
jgi:LPS export ABC transporter permease LptF/LPS export ABC transporter permease LptG